MAEEKNNHSENGHTGEITTIREILMGSQMGVYEAKFKAIEDRLTNLENQLKENANQLKTSAEDNSAAIGKMQQFVSTELTSKLSNSEENFLSRIKSLEDSIEKSKAQEREALSKMFLDISNRLLK